MIPRTLSSDLPVGYHHSFFKTLKVMPVQIAPNLEMGYRDNLTEIQERWRESSDRMALCISLAQVADKSLWMSMWVD